MHISFLIFCKIFLKQSFFKTSCYCNYIFDLLYTKVTNCLSKTTVLRNSFCRIFFNILGGESGRIKFHLIRSSCFFFFFFQLNLNLFSTPFVISAKSSVLSCAVLYFLAVLHFLAMLEIIQGNTHFSHRNFRRENIKMKYS